MRGVHFVIQGPDDVDVASRGVEAETSEGVSAHEQVGNQTVGAFVSVRGHHLTDDGPGFRILGNGQFLEDKRWRSGRITEMANTYTLTPALTKTKGPILFICYMGISMIANLENKEILYRGLQTCVCYKFHCTYRLIILYTNLLMVYEDRLIVVYIRDFYSDEPSFAFLPLSSPPLIPGDDGESVSSTDFVI